LSLTQRLFSRQSALARTAATAVKMVRPPPLLRGGPVQLEVVFIETPSAFWANYVNNYKEKEVIALAVQVTEMGLCHPLHGVTNLKYKLLYFLTPNKKKFKEKG